MFFFKDRSQLSIVSNIGSPSVRRTGALVPVAVLVAMPVAILGACAGPRPTELWLDLIAELPWAEVEQETGRIDLGTPEGRPALGRGWSWDEAAKGGTTFVWAEGESSELEVYVSASRPLTVILRCLPFRYPGSPAQEASVTWDGHDLGRATLGDGFTELRFEVPVELVEPGRRRVTLTPSYAQEARAVLGGDDARRLSMACESVELDGRRTVEARPQGDDGSLWLPGGTELSFFIEAPDGTGAGDELFLEWDGSEQRPGSALEVLWQTDTAPTRVLSQVGASAEVREGPARQVALPMDDLIRGPARLALRAPSNPDFERTGVRLASPRLTRGAAGASGAALEVPDAPEQAGAVSQALPQARPPILLWVVDTLRVDRLGLYGHDRPVSPNFDLSAASSVVFDRAVASSSWTRPTAATLLTGVGPERHGIAGVDDRLDDEFVTLAEHLGRAGYATLGYSANGNVSAETGFAQGFDRFAYHVVDVDVLLRLALEELDRLTAAGDTRPVFLMIHSVEPHAAFAPKEPFRSRFAPEETDPWLGSNEHIRALGDKKAPVTDDVVRRLFDLYDAEIAWNDHVFGQALSALEARGPEPIVVVVADHGEAFRERGVFGHGWDLHREVLHVPFWIRLPGRAPRRVEAPVHQADLLPTLLDVLGLPAVDGVEGRSLRPWIDGAQGAKDEADTRPLISTMDYEHRSGASLVRGRFKLIEPRSPDFAAGRLLFDLVDDPAEQRNLAAELPVTAGRLARLLHGYLSRVDRVDAAPVELDDEARRQLKALGYL